MNRLIRGKLILGIALSSTWLAACGGHKAEYWPTTAWRTSTPEAQGIDSAGLLPLFTLAAQRSLNLHSLILIRHGTIVLEAYFYPFQKGMDHDLASATKSVTATALAVAQQNGLSIDLHQPVLAYFPDRQVAFLDERKAAMTVEDLLTMRSGLAFAEETEFWAMMQTSDWVQYMLDREMAWAPGTHFNYSNGDSLLIAAIVQQAVQATVLAFAKEHLFAPLGISRVRWPGPTGITNGFGDLHLLPTDMAKIGLLYLRGGVWEGQPILPASWTTTATRKHTDSSDPNAGYGYQWWTYNGGLYAAQGRGGQYIAVDEALDLVAVATGGAAQDSVGGYGDLFTSVIIPAVRSEDPLPANPAAVGDLADAVAAVAAAPAAQPVAAAPALAALVSGVRYVFADTPDGVRGMTLFFDSPAQGRVRVELADRTLELALGLDGSDRITPRPDGYDDTITFFDLPSALRGAWQGEGQFVLRWDEIGNINLWTLTFQFSGTTAEIDAVESTYMPPRHFTARQELP